MSGFKDPMASFSPELNGSSHEVSYQLLDPTLTAAEVTLIDETQVLMMEYSEARLARPLQVDEITTKYFDSYINLLTNALPTIKSPAALVDTLAVLRCLRAVYFDGSVLEWVQAADPGWDMDGVAELLKVEDPRENPILWRYVNETAVVGRLSVVYTVLSEAVAGVLDSLDSAVQSCISDTLYLCQNYEMGSRESRKSAINLRIKCEELTELEWRAPLTTLAKILQGDKHTIVRVAPTWYSAVGGLYMYVDPAIDELPTYFKLATARHPVDRTLDWEEACAALMERHLLFTIASLKQLDATAAMVVSEFAHQRGLLEEYRGTGKASIREYAALRHVLVCLSNPDLVMAGFEMLDNMSTSRAARELAAQALPQVTERDPSLTDVAIELATELQLGNVVAKLLNVNAERAANDGDIVTSVEAYVSGGNLVAARKACWTLFEASLVKGSMAVARPEALEILTAPKASTDLAPAVAACLAPCAVLAGLFATIAKSGQASEYIKSLLSFSGMPAAYYPLLVALITQLDLRENADPAIMALLMSSLDRWEASKSEEKQRGLSLLDDGRQAGWAADIDQSCTAEEIVWMLRRRLAYDVVVL